jgi:hypothetical protein
VGPGNTGELRGPNGSKSERGVYAKTTFGPGSPWRVEADDQHAYYEAEQRDAVKGLHGPQV